jgi:hypothetical protein
MMDVSFVDARQLRGPGKGIIMYVSIMDQLKNTIMHQLIG